MSFFFFILHCFIYFQFLNCVFHFLISCSHFFPLSFSNQKFIEFGDALADEGNSHLDICKNPFFCCPTILSQPHNVYTIADDCDHTFQLLIPDKEQKSSQPGDHQAQEKQRVQKDQPIEGTSSGIRFNIKDFVPGGND